MKRIEEVCRLSGVSRRTLQYYDNEGILPVKRSEENYRLYDETAMARLWEILWYKEMGFELKEIKNILTVTQKEKNNYLNEKIQIIEGKIQDLEKQIKFMSGNLSMDQKNKNKLILGCSVHSVEDAIEAEKLGASYLTAGHIFATDCKRGLPPRGMEFLKQVCETVNIPVYAIGGIGLNDGKIDSVCECGAAGACIMSAFMAI